MFRLLPLTACLSSSKPSVDPPDCDGVPTDDARFVLLLLALPRRRRVSPERQTRLVRVRRVPVGRGSDETGPGSGRPRCEDRVIALERVREDVAVLVDDIEKEWGGRMRKYGEDCGRVDDTEFVHPGVATRDRLEPDDITGDEADENV